MTILVRCNGRQRHEAIHNAMRYSFSQIRFPIFSRARGMAFVIRCDETKFIFLLRKTTACASDFFRIIHELHHANTPLSTVRKCYGLPPNCDRSSHVVLNSEKRGLWRERKPLCYANIFFFFQSFAQSVYLYKGRYEITFVIIPTTLFVFFTKWSFK